MQAQVVSRRTLGGIQARYRPSTGLSEDHSRVQQHLKYHVSEPDLNPRQLQQAITAAIGQLEAVLEQD
jgi:hypothetical protein